MEWRVIRPSHVLSGVSPFSVRGMAFRRNRNLYATTYTARWIARSLGPTCSSRDDGSPSEDLIAKQHAILNA